MNGYSNGLGGSPQTLVQGANAMMGKGGLQQDSPVLPFWLFPRANAELVQRVASIPTPAAATLTQVLQLAVPPGFRFILRGIRQSFQTGTGGAPVWVEGSGDIVWTLDVNSPIMPGASLGFSGYALPDMGAMTDARGSSIAPWPVDGYNVFEPEQVLRYKVLTTVNIPAGVPNYITCGLFGWWEKAL
jgi:hypothetical protein